MDEDKADLKKKTKTLTHGKRGKISGSLFFKVEVLGSSLLGHLLKEFSLRLTWCLWLVGYYGTRGLVEVRVS